MDSNMLVPEAETAKPKALPPTMEQPNASLPQSPGGPMPGYMEQGYSNCQDVISIGITAFGFGVVLLILGAMLMVRSTKRR